VHSGLIRTNGRVATRAGLVRRAVSADDVAAVLAGHDVSTSRDVRGSTVFIEARPTDFGGIVVVQRQRDATAQDRRAIRNVVIAVLIAGGLAAIIGLLVAWRLARPLRRTAAAAHSLAAGNRDVTLPADGPAEVVEVSDAVMTLAGALRHSEARQREFLLSVSHDLRTPLTAISGYAESLAGGVIPAEESAHVGGVLLGESKRLERLVGDLLDLARLGAGDIRVELSPVDVAALVRDAGRVWSARCAAAGVSFRTEAPDAPVLAHTDPTRLRQVLDGLLENALRVTPTGAPIVLAARAEPGQVVTEVRDGGPGLTDADLAVAFEQGVLYQRYRGVRQVGTGLGLAIVHGLVGRLGGSVEAGHAAEGGARFTVRLPAHVPHRTVFPAG
jgi:two-component system OmpR family sensor kinase